MTPEVTKPGTEAEPLGPRPVVRFAAALLSAFVLLDAVREPSVVTLAAAATVVAIVVIGIVRLTQSEGSVGLVLAAGVTLFSLGDGALTSIDDPGGATAIFAASLAYPCFAKVLLDHVRGRYLVRARDLLVDAVLIGAAASVVFQAAFPWEGAGVGSLGRAIPSAFIGLDVMLIVIAARPLTMTAMRHGVLPVSAAAATLVVAAHVRTAAPATGDPVVVSSVQALLAISLAMVGVAAVLALRSASRSFVGREPLLFSTAHACVLVVAVLAAPVLLAADAARGVSISPSVAVSAVLSSAVLGGHFVAVLRERAASEHQSMHDPLTGLPNRQLFVDRLDRALAHARRGGTPVGVLYIDLDRFKDVNDTFGHSAGDRLLQGTAHRLTDCCRDEDTVARLAGDEFAILLAHLDDAEDAQVAAGRVLDALSDTWMVGGQRLRGAGSVGVAVYPADGETSADLLAAADAAMYQAKDNGGRSVELFSTDLASTAATRLEIETELHDAIEGDGLELYYQPIVDVQTGRTCGAEALIRWHHPDKGFLTPASFIPVAEESELIVELGEWVLGEACREIVRLADSGHGDRFVTVNISSRHFRHDVVSAVASALRTTGADPHRLMVELTESAAVDDLDVVAGSLRDLADLGVRAAIDDFGTGYCGLQYLGDLTLETLKIDRSFVQTLTPRSAAIVTATIAMGHSLGMSIVAEGVETPEQHRFLQQAGCDRVQGYLFGRPVPAGELVKRLDVEGPLRFEWTSAAAPRETVRPMSQA